MSNFVDKDLEIRTQEIISEANRINNSLKDVKPHEFEAYLLKKFGPEMVEFAKTKLGENYGLK